MKKTFRQQTIFIKTKQPSDPDVQKYSKAHAYRYNEPCSFQPFIFLFLSSCDNTYIAEKHIGKYHRTEIVQSKNNFCCLPPCPTSFFCKKSADQIQCHINTTQSQKIRKKPVFYIAQSFMRKIVGRDQCYQDKRCYLKIISIHFFPPSFCSHKASGLPHISSPQWFYSFHRVF